MMESQDDGLFNLDEAADITIRVFSDDTYVCPTGLLGIPSRAPVQGTDGAVGWYCTGYQCHL